MHTRRTILNTVRAGILLGFAGCIEPVTKQNRPQSVSATLSQYTTSCGSNPKHDIRIAAANATDGTASITGIIPAPNPCQEVILREVIYEDEKEEPEVRVLLQRNPDDSAGCTECLGELEYEVEVEFPAQFQKLVIEHWTWSGKTVKPVAIGVYYPDELMTVATAE